MASQLTVNAYPNGVDNTLRRQEIDGTCALTGTYVTGGIPTSWITMLDAATGHHFVGAFGPQTTQPIKARFFSIGGGETTIPPYSYIWDKTNNALRILNTSTGLELAAAATITADTIGFEAEFVRGY